MDCLACEWLGRNGWPKTVEYAEAVAQHILEGHGS